MNKNTVIGFVLIGLILIGFSWYNTKIFKEQERARFVAMELLPSEGRELVIIMTFSSGVSWRSSLRRRRRRDSEKGESNSW